MSYKRRSRRRDTSWMKHCCCLLYTSIPASVCILEHSACFSLILKSVSIFPAPAAAPFDPVSYTHLDVYKRQGDGSCPVRIGGHSKGGNLAVYAAVHCSSGLQDRILAVYSLSLIHISLSTDAAPAIEKYAGKSGAADYRKQGWYQLYCEANEEALNCLLYTSRCV